MQQKFLVTAVVLGALAVALGAFGAHALKTLISEKGLQVYETAVKYQFYHALALLATGILYKEFTNKFIKAAGRLFTLGTILFSGSLYLLTIKEITNQDWLKFAGPITPTGGLFLVCGWACLAAGILNQKNKQT